MTEKQNSKSWSVSLGVVPHLLSPLGAGADIQYGGTLPRSLCGWIPPSPKKHHTSSDQLLLSTAKKCTVVAWSLYYSVRTCLSSHVENDSVWPMFALSVISFPGRKFQCVLSPWRGCYAESQNRRGNEGGCGVVGGGRSCHGRET